MPLTTHPYLSAEVKEQNYTFTSPLGFHGLFWAELCLYLNSDSVEPALDESIIFWALDNPSLVEWSPNVAILRIRKLGISFIPFFVKSMLFCYAKISMMEPVKRSP